MTWRIDDILMGVFQNYGAIWLGVALLALGIVVFGRIFLSLLVTLVLLVCTQVWYFPLHYMGFWLRWWLLVILFVRGVALLARSPPGSSDGKLARRLVFALGGIAVISGAWSENPEYTIKLGISFVLGLAVTFGLLWRALDGPDVVPHLARGALWFGLAAFGGGFGVTALAYVAGDWDLFEKTGWDGRYSGVFYNPNAAGLLAAMVLPVVAAAPRPYLGRSASLRLLVIALTFATVFLSGSRSALIGSVLALCVLGLYRYGAGAVISMVVAGVAIAAIMLYAPLDDIDDSAVGHISRTKHLSTLSGRLELWEEGWEAAQGHLVFGQGWGKSRALGNADLDLAVEIGYVKNATNLHNAHLQLLIDVGVVGVALFWGFCLCIVQSGWNILRSERTPRNAFALVIFASAFVLLADTWVHGAIWSMGSPTTLVFWGLCAASLKEGYRARAERIGAAWGTPVQRSAPAPAPAPAPVRPATA